MKTVDAPRRAARPALAAEVVSAFAPIAMAAGRTDVDQLLELVVREARDLAGVARGAVYLRSEDTGLFEGRCAQGAPWVKAAIPRTTCGYDWDGLTREIVATGRAVPVTDARHDSRPVRSAVMAWGIRSLLGVPLTDGGEIFGLIFVDDAEYANAYDQGETELLEQFARLVSGVIVSALETDKLRATAKTLDGRNRTLQAAVAVGDRLASVVGEGGSVVDVAAAVSRFTGKPCAVYDRGGRRLAAVTPPEAPGDRPADFPVSLADLSEVAETVASAKAGSATVVTTAGANQHLLVVRAPQGSAEGGTIMLRGGNGRMRLLDATVARRAAAMVDLIVRTDGYKAECLRGLVGDLLLGRVDDRLATRASLSDFALGQPHVVCVVADGDRPLDAQLVGDAFARVTDRPAELVAQVGSQAAVLLALDRDLPIVEAVNGAKELVSAALASLPAGVAAGLSSPCRAAGDYPHGLAEARSALKGAGGHPVATVEDLGPAYLLNVDGDPERAMRFATRVMAPLLEDPASGGEMLIETLEAFFACSRNIRRTAEQLDVHENTIRYRLGSVMRRTGLDVAGNAEHELMVQLALQILRTRAVA